MSVKDFNKVYNFKNMTTGEVVGTIHNIVDYPCYGDRYVNRILVEVEIGDLKLLDFVHDCIDNGHGCLVSVGYEPDLGL